jgi:hypothetical protein
VFLIAQTLGVIVLGAVFLVTGLLLRLLWLRRTQQPACDWWMANLGMESLGLFSVVVGNALQRPWFLILGNLLLVLGAACSWIGARRYCGGSPLPQRIFPAVLALYGAPLVYLSVIHPDLHARLILNSLAYASWPTLVTLTYLRGIPVHRAALRQVALTAYGLPALFFVGRALFLLLQGPGGDRMIEWGVTLLMTLPLALVRAYALDLLSAQPLSRPQRQMNTAR